MSQEKKQNIKSNIESFLNPFRVASSDSPYNFISMADDYKGAYYLDKNQIKEFTKLYAEAITNGGVFSIAEKPKEYGPLLIDIDIEVSKDGYNNERLYNNEMIFEIIEAYRQASNGYLNLSNEELSVALFEKPQPTIKEDKIKDGVHLIFHGVVVHYKLRFLIRDKVIKLLSGSELFKNHNLEKLIDKQVINANCWLLPGSKKSDGQLYELKSIYDQNNNPIDIPEILADKYKLINLFSLQHKIRCEKNKTKYVEGITTEIINEQFSKLNDKKLEVQLTEPILKPFEKEKSVDDINKIIESCLLCLPIENYNEFELWSKIAFVINNELGYNGIDILLNWSSDGEGYDKTKVEQFYKNIKPSATGLKIGTLKKMAKESNPELYKKLFSKKKEITKEPSEKEVNIPTITTCVDGSFRDIAHLIKDEVAELFVYSNSTFYTFDENIKTWKETSENIVKSNLSDILYNKILSEYNNNKDTLINDERFPVKYMKANKTIGNPDNIKKVIVYLYEFITVDKFEEKLNRSQDYLLPVRNNLCINLITGEVIARTREHYFTFFIDIEYNINVGTTNADNFFRSVMNFNEDKFLYLKKVLGSFLCAQTDSQSFFIWYGKGSNGKSILLKLIAQVLGPFYATVEKGLFIDSGKKACSNSASPEKLILKDIRLGIVVETDENEKIAESFLKNLSGDDDITARPLFKNPITFRPKLSAVICTNNKPTFDINSYAMKRRIKLFNFDAKFVENPSKPNEQKINKYFIKKLCTEYLSEVLLFMVQGAIEFNNNTDMTPPKCIEDDINSFIDEIDPTNKFISSKIQITTNKKDKIKRGELYELFKTWCTDNGNTIPFKKTDFFKATDRIIGASTKYNGDFYYFNVKSICDDDDSDNDEQKSGLDA